MLEALIVITLFITLPFWMVPLLDTLWDYINKDKD